MKRIRYLVTALSLVTASLATAAPFSIEEQLQASKLAIDDFKKTNPDHVEHFIGFKTWKSEDDAKVKIYVKHDDMNMDFNYLCHKHDDKMECHAQ